MSCLATAYPAIGNKAAAIVEVAMLFIVGSTHCRSNGPIALTVTTEIFSQHVRDKAGWGEINHPWKKPLIAFIKGFSLSILE